MKESGKVVNLTQLEQEIADTKAEIWYQKRPHIFYGYRIMKDRVVEIFKTMFSIHNETSNIWTHFLSFIPALW